MSRLNVYGCRQLAKVIPQVADVLNGTGPRPSAITLGGTEIYFEKPGPKVERHERQHVIQAARCCPLFLCWLPLRARAWAGAVRYWKKYIKFHTEYGYTNNPFEVEARAAEEDVA